MASAADRLQADETRNRQILERIPAGRWGNPEDLAGAAVFLASAASNYVHGHILVVDGDPLADIAVRDGAVCMAWTVIDAAQPGPLRERLLAGTTR